MSKAVLLRYLRGDSAAHLSDCCAYLCHTASLHSQAALPCLLLAAQHGATCASELDLRGGTDAAMAPPAAYLAEVLLPTLRRCLGVEASLQVSASGIGRCKVKPMWAPYASLEVLQDPLCCLLL